MPTIDEAVNANKIYQANLAARPAQVEAPAPVSQVAPMPPVSTKVSLLPSRGVFPPGIANNSADSDLNPPSSIQSSVPKIPTNLGTLVVTTGTSPALQPASAGNSPVVQAANPTGIPQQVTGLTVSEIPTRLSGSMIALVTAAWTPALGDAFYYSAQVWVTGYHGSFAPQLITSGKSPLTVNMDATGETVSISVVAVSASGVSAGLAGAPSVIIKLSATSGTLPPPNVSVLLAAYSGGYQFTFDYLSGIVGTIVTGYNVYRNTSANTFAGSTLIRNVPQNSTASGSYVFQDAVNAGSLTYYYFVTSVDIYGSESAPVSAQTGAVPSILIGYQGAWDSSLYYTAGAEVSLAGIIYLCILANTNQTPPNLTYWTPLSGISYAGVWSSIVAYTTGQTVSVSGAIYIAIASSTNQNPTSTAGYWQLLSASVNFAGTYSGTTIYPDGSMVVYNGSFWVAITNVPAGNTPVPGSSYWLNTGASAIKLAVYDNGLAYSIGMECVGTDGNVYQAIAATTGNAPPNVAYWQLVGPNSLTSVPGSSTYLNATLSLFAGPTWSSSNNFRPVTNSVGGTTAATSYATVGSFLMNFVGNISTYGGALTLTQTVAPHGDFVAGNPDVAVSVSGLLTAWSNPTYAETLNSVGATSALAASGVTNTLRVSFPSLGIPTDHTILGITVSIVREKSAGSGTIKDASVMFRKAGVQNGSDFADASTAWPGTYGTKTYGGTSNLLGGTWAPADFNTDDNVDLNLSALESGGSFSATANVDYITFSVRTDGGTFTAKARIRIGANDGTEATLTGVGPTAGTSFISAPATGNQTVIVEAEVTSVYGGTVQALYSQIDALPQSGSQFT
jgi:hypothetical protein